MSTSFCVEIGYQSGFPEQKVLAAYDVLRDAALAICEQPERIAAEALAFGAPASLGEASLAEYAESYRVRDDLTITFHPPVGLEDLGCVRQSASGGAPGRVLKEHLRRAVVRLLMQEMHRRGIEVNVLVR